ncbi:MAG: PspC domain-containing protein [Treponema sp.]|nr:PspC domain-containing protein [Treponema sp.]
MKKKLYKSNKNKMIFGVCGGIAEFFNCDPTIIRLILVIIALFKGFGIILYLLAALIIPSADIITEDQAFDDTENLKSANINDKEKKSRKNHSPHSDEEFNSYFKNSK